MEIWVLCTCEKNQPLCWHSSKPLLLVTFLHVKGPVYLMIQPIATLNGFYGYIMVTYFVYRLRGHKKSTFSRVCLTDKFRFFFYPLLLIASMECLLFVVNLKTHKSFLSLHILQKVRKFNSIFSSKSFKRRLEMHQKYSFWTSVQQR